MGQPVVHFEIIGKDPEQLRRYYRQLFGWEFDTSGPVAQAVSEAGKYGFVDPGRTTEGVGIPSGVGGGPGYDHAPGSGLVVGHFTDPEGHLIGVAAART